MMAKRPKSSASLRFYPILFGWGIALLLIEEATANPAFLFPTLPFGILAPFFLRVAFLLGISLGILFFARKPRFPNGIFPLIALLSLGLSFIPAPMGLVYAFRMLLALFSGALAGGFGSDFFLFFTNREKGFSLGLAFLFSPLAYLPVNSEILSFTLLGLLALAFLFRKPLPEKAHPLPYEALPEWWLLALSFLAFVLSGSFCLSFLKNLVPLDFSFLYCALGGGLAGIILAFSFFKSRKIYLTYGLYLSFLFSALGGIALFFSTEAIGLAFAGFFLSLSHTLGLFSLYYVLGVYTKKYQNLRFYSFGAFSSALAYVLSLLFSLYLPFSLQEENRYWAALFVSVPLIVLFFTPLFFQNEKSKDWVRDLLRNEVSSSDPLSALFEEKGLSKREKEVARFLLKGLTLRQIAGEMGLSYPTINTYQNAIYRKLGIASRAELLLLCHPLLR